MKNMKKLLCLALALLTLFSVIVLPASAANANEYVAEISVFSSTGGTTRLGHSWVYFENISDETLTVGAYRLKPDESVSVGVFTERTLSNGRGVYYNVESYLIHKMNTGNGRRSTTAKITKAQLKDASDFINKNNRWTVTFNCAAFAEKVWNAACPSKKVWSLGTPSFLKTFLLFRNYRTNKPVNNPDYDECFKHTKSGTLEPCKGALTFKF